MPSRMSPGPSDSSEKMEIESPSIEGKGCWWFLFPYNGLILSDDHVDLGKPMFGDATIISKHHAPILLSELERSALVSNSGAVKIFRAWITAHATRPQYPPDSFVAVRRSGILSRNSRTGNEQIIKQAKSRAYEIGALLSMAILAHWSIPQTCVLSEFLHFPTSTFLAVDLQHARVHGQSKMNTPVRALVGNGALSKSRAELQALLALPQLFALRDAFRLHAKPIGISETIRRACVHLAETMHGSRLETQVLGAVTSLEILFGDDDRYKVTGRRIVALLGQDAEQRWNAKGVIEARNKYVHQGTEIELATIADNAIELALACILRFAAVASSFPIEWSSYSIWTTYTPLYSDTPTFG
jgi:hypothetical protein